MRLQTVLKTAIFLSVAFVLAPGVPAQKTNSKPSPQPTVEAMQETDRLPFMKKKTGDVAEEPGSGSLLLKTLGAMMLIIGLVFFGAWGLKKLGFGSFGARDSVDTPELAILSSVSQGSGRTLSVVRFGNRTLLIGSTAQTFTFLGEESVNESLLEPTPRSVAEMLAEERPSFEQELARANQRTDSRYGGQMA